MQNKLELTKITAEQFWSIHKYKNIDPASITSTGGLFPIREYHGSNYESICVSYLANTAPG